VDGAKFGIDRGDGMLENTSVEVSRPPSVIGPLRGFFVAKNQRNRASKWEIPTR
jgi:hypothetical protein